MVNFVLVVEGGGTGPALKAEMAKGFRRFLDRIGPNLGKPRIIRGGGRTQALDKFNTAWQSRSKGDIVMLLIDSEEPVSYGSSKIDHLVSRDGWKNKPSDVKESDVFLMVCVMETWICADREALALFYNGGFDEKQLPAVKTLEGVQRSVIYDALGKATKDCKKRRPYSKGEHSFELISQIDPNKLDVLPHAKEFINHLKTMEKASP
jgi:hypothetical protein